MAKLLLSAKEAAGKRPAVAAREIEVDFITLDRLIPAADIIDDIREILITVNGVKGQFQPVRRILDLVEMGTDGDVKAADLAKEVTAADFKAVYEFYNEALREAGLVSKADASGEKEAASSSTSMTPTSDL